MSVAILTMWGGFFSFIIGIGCVASLPGPGQGWSFGDGAVLGTAIVLCVAGVVWAIIGLCWICAPDIRPYRVVRSRR